MSTGRFGRNIYGGTIQQVSDLHSLLIETDSGTKALQDYGITAAGVAVEVVFQGLESRLIALINEAEVVVGCVAWLTNHAILNALIERRGVSIIVQKEDFLRPDVAAKIGWQFRLRQAYGLLPSMSRYSFPTLVGGLSVCSSPDLASVRCVGNHNAASTTGPRAHHKFAVFCRWNHQDDDAYGGEIEPYAVWTGSFNFTETANRSFENAVVVHDVGVATAFLHEYSQIVALSEPLDWDCPWVQPEWRLGT